VTDVLLVVLILAVGALAVAVFALLKRRGQGNAEAENQLRAQVAGVEATAESFRGQTVALAAQAADLRQRLEAEHGARVAAETRLDAERKSFDEQRQLLDEAETRLKDAFTALSADALKDSRTQFLSQADQRLKPIQDLIATYEGHLREIEKARNDAYGGLKNNLDSLAKAHDLLQREAHQLSTALRSPTVRGRWGEMTLRRVVEVAGMDPHCTFEEQASVTTEDGRLQPDMKIMLPGNRVIVVDSKVPLAAYLDAFEAKDEAARQQALGRHAQDVRRHVQALSRKAYWDQFKNAAEFVVLFLPGESFFSAALEQDRSLLEDAMANKVFLATPTTLMALLNVVAHGWRQQEMAENAEKIGAVGRELYERVCTFMGHFGKVGEGLKGAVGAYEAAIGSYEKRIVPAAKRLAEQAAITDKELPDVPRVDGPSRALAAPAIETPGLPAPDSVPAAPDTSASKGRP
jgi:DNA recombination protein RmuC